MPNPGFNLERDPSTCRSGNGKYASVLWVWIPGRWKINKKG